MQVIWSRAAQTRSCRCTSCLHHATTLARRTTTAAGKRRLKTSDIFTACYSAMFATAAVLDAKSKDSRRKQWDQAIADVKAGLDGVKGNSLSSTPDEAASTDYGSPAVPHEVNENSVQLVFGAIEGIIRSGVSGHAEQQYVDRQQVAKGLKTRLETRLRLLDAQLRDSPAMEKIEHIDGEDPILPEGEVESENTSEIWPSFKGWEPWKANHFLQMESMVAKLVTSLLLSTKRFVLENGFLAMIPTRSPADCLTQEFDDVAQHIVSLQASTSRLPAYSMSNREARTERADLNKSITAMVSKKISDQGSIDLMVAKLCYNLLVSSSPPNIHTYTTMIAHFTRLKQNDLAQAVIDSFFVDSQFVPNTWTVSAILDHYAATKDDIGFRSVIQLMRGVDGNMRVKRRHLPVVDEAETQPLASKPRIIHCKSKQHWKMPRNDRIFHSLIRGSLQLFGVRRAVLYFKAALREGWQLTSDLFIEIAKACLTERNKEAAVALISALISQWQAGKSLTLEDNASVRNFIRQLLLHFCGMDDLTSIEDNKSLPHNFTRLDLSGWLYNIRLKDISDKLKRSAETVSRLDMILKASSSRQDNDPQQFISEMLDYLSWKSQREHLILLAGRDTAGYAARFADIEMHIATIYESFPPQSREAYNARLAQLPHPLSLLKRLEVSLELRRAHLAVPEAQDDAPAIRSPMEHLTKNSSLVVQPSPTSQNSAAIAIEVPIPAVDGGPELDKMNPKSAVRPESFKRSQHTVPLPWPEAVPIGYAMLRYSDSEGARKSHLVVAAG